MNIILDPGHGMSNRKLGVFDTGAVSGQTREADIALEWANELRTILKNAGHTVVRTRMDNKDPAPVGQRAGIARKYHGEIMLSIHCNDSDEETAHGTETFYRGAGHKEKAVQINKAVVEALGTTSRGVKTEEESQHPTLAVMSFQPCFLVELGFISNPGDREKMMDPALRNKACEALAKVITNQT